MNRHCVMNLKQLVKLIKLETYLIRLSNYSFSNIEYR